jgi:hypothetical protein
MVYNHIIVGLGGTGGNVIKAFRQQIVDKYGDINDVDAPQNIDFLYVDSQSTEFDEGKWKYQGKNIKLHGESELVLMAGVLKDKLEDHSSRSEFLGSDSDWGDILADKELAKKAGNQMRRLGRVNLSSNITEIVERVAKKEANLSQNKQAKTFIHVVAGLAGGTGSGSVVDVTAHLLRFFKDRSGDVVLNLYLKLPETQVPQGWGGQFATSNESISFYKVNGYAALKEINGLATGVFEPYDITKKNERIKNTNLIQSAYIVSERNAEGIGFSEVISPIASLLFLKTITSDTEEKNTGSLSLPQTLNNVDTFENITISPSSYWGLSAKFCVPGVYKIGVPKVQIRESFAQLLVLNAFNKLLYKNYDEVGGTGYIGEASKNNDVKREESQIKTSLRSALLDEWYLTYDYLILDNPMIDANNNLLNLGRDDYSFKVAYQKEYSSRYTKISTTKQYGGNFINEKEVLKFTQQSVNDYFNKDYKGVGYERYYVNMLNNLARVSEFLTERIKDKMFGKNGGKASRLFPLESYSDLILCISQDYIPNLEKDLKNKQLTYAKEVERLHEELKNINVAYINSFGIFGSSKKREISVLNFNVSLEKLWLCTVSLKGINFAFQLLPFLQSKLMDVKKEIELNVKTVVDRRSNLELAYGVEKQRLNGVDQLKGMQSITNNEGLAKFQEALMKDKTKFEGVMNRLESLLFENKDKLFENPSSLMNKDLPIMEHAYQEIDDLLSAKNFKDLLNEEDQFYNAHVIDVLYNKYNKNAEDSALKELFSEMLRFSAPLASISSIGGKGNIKTNFKKIIILPELEGINLQNKDVLQFYSDLKKTIKGTIGVEIKEIKDPRFKNEITIAQFLYPVRTDMIDNLEHLKKEYDELSKNPKLNFLMHTEDSQNLVDLIPPKTKESLTDMLLPYLMVLSSISDGFEYYGDANFWKIATPPDSDTDYIKLEANTIEDFLKLDYSALDKANSVAFVSPLVFTSIKLKGEQFLNQGDETIDMFMKETKSFVRKQLEIAKNDTSNPNYKRFYNALQTLERISNIKLQNEHC